MARLVVQPQNSPSNAPKRRRGVTWEDARAIVRLMAEKRMLPAEACGIVGLNYRTWARWINKEKNHVRVSALIEQARGARLEVLINRVDAASQGIGMKQPDWRAAAWLAQVIDRERYGDQKVIGSQTINNTQVNTNVFVEAAKRVYGPGTSQPTALPPVQPAKQLSDAKAQDNDKEISGDNSNSRK